MKKSKLWIGGEHVEPSGGEYFEDLNVQVKSLKHLLKAKAVLCPGLTIEFVNEKKSNDKVSLGSGLCR